MKAGNNQFRLGQPIPCEDRISYLESEWIVISMDGKDRAIDYIFIEMFRRSVKYDYEIVTE